MYPIIIIIYTVQIDLQLLCTISQYQSITNISVKNHPVKSPYFQGIQGIQDRPRHGIIGARSHRVVAGAVPGVGQGTEGAHRVELAWVFSMGTNHGKETMKNGIFFEPEKRGVIG